MIAALSAAWSLLSGPAGKYILGALAAVALVIGANWWLRDHDAALEAQWTAAQAVAVSQAVAAHQKQADAALADAVADAETRARASQTVKEVILHAPVSACPTAPALLAARTELLRRHPNSGAGASEPAGSTGAGVPGAGHP